jgi:hypothetical protein
MTKIDERPESSLTMSEYLAIEKNHPSIKLATADSYVVLATPCVRCRASGCVVPANRGLDGFERCDLCSVRGFLMTPDGRELQRFIQVFGSSLFGEPEHKGAHVNNAGGSNGEAFR